MGLVRGFLAMSLDGFIAGPHDEIAWLEEPRTSGIPVQAGAWAGHPVDALEFEAFMAAVGAIVMGRRTFDVVQGMPGPWFYGETPMLIVTSSELHDAPATAKAFHGSVPDAIDAARQLAGTKDVYVDGGRTVRAAMDAGLVDHIVVTVIPVALGAGIALFAGLERHAEFAVERVATYGPGCVQLHLSTRAGAGA